MPRPTEPPVYQGVDVLETMASAHNYNAHLTYLVAAHVGQRTPLLDFGAGSGTMARLVAASIGARPVCVEPDAALAQGLRCDGFRVLRSLHEVAADSVAALYSLNVLEHIYDDASAVTAIHRVLAPRGLCFIYVPAFPLLYTGFDRRIGHYRRYRRDALLRLFRGAGFDVQRARYADSLGFFATLVFKHLPGNGRLKPRTLALYDRMAFPISRRLDWLLGGFVGKNVWLVAVKPTPLEVGHSAATATRGN
jgi:SAM-dependent methyltransferase